MRLALASLAVLSAPLAFAAPALPTSDAAFAAALSAPPSPAPESAAPQSAPVPKVKVCDEAMDKLDLRMGYTLMLLTDSAAYYSHQDCDICDELDACDLKTGQVRSVIIAHSVSCADLAPFRKGKVAYDSCQEPAPADPAWDALVKRAVAKNAPVNVWGMDRDETRHSFTVIFVKAEGKVYITDDEDRERDLTHTVWVTDMSGERAFFGVSYTRPYGRGASTKTEMTGNQAAFKACKELLLRAAR